MGEHTVIKDVTNIYFQKVISAVVQLKNIRLPLGRLSTTTDYQAYFNYMHLIYRTSISRRGRVNVGVVCSSLYIVVVVICDGVHVVYGNVMFLVGPPKFEGLLVKEQLLFF